MRCRFSSAIRCTAIRENPQNTPEVATPPSPALTAADAVRVQLEAASRNDDPWPRHGIATLYEFCYDAGSLERSRFFGFSKDLYHLDHFMGAVANFCPELLGCRSFEVGPERPPRDGAARAAGAVAFDVEVEAAGEVRGGGGGQGRTGSGRAVFEFTMQRQEWGLRKGCWQTKTLLRVEGGQEAEEGER